MSQYSSLRMRLSGKGFSFKTFHSMFPVWIFFKLNSKLDTLMPTLKYAYIYTTSVMGTNIFECFIWKVLALVCLILTLVWKKFKQGTCPFILYRVIGFKEKSFAGEPHTKWRILRHNLWISDSIGLFNAVSQLKSKPIYFEKFKQEHSRLGCFYISTKFEFSINVFSLTRWNIYLN